MTGTDDTRRTRAPERSSSSSGSHRAVTPATPITMDLRSYLLVAGAFVTLGGAIAGLYFQQSTNSKAVENIASSVEAATKEWASAVTALREETRDAKHERAAINSRLEDTNEAIDEKAAVIHARIEELSDDVKREIRRHR